MEVKKNMKKIVLGIVVMAVLLAGLGAGFVAGYEYGYQDGYSNGCADGEEGLFYRLIDEGAISVVDTNNGYSYTDETGTTYVVGSDTVKQICNYAPGICARNKQMTEWMHQDLCSIRCNKCYDDYCKYYNK